MFDHTSSSLNLDIHTFQVCIARFELSPTRPKGIGYGTNSIKYFCFVVSCRLLSMGILEVNIIIFKLWELSCDHTAHSLAHSLITYSLTYTSALIHSITLRFLHSFLIISEQESEIDASSVSIRKTLEAENDIDIDVIIQDVTISDIDNVIEVNIILVIIPMHFLLGSFVFELVLKR